MTVPLDRGESVDLTADGVVQSHGREVAKFVANELRATAGGVIAVQKDGALLFNGRSEAGLRFDDEDQLVADGGSGMTVDDAGHAVIRIGSDEGKVDVQGFRPEGRRAVLLILVQFFMEPPKLP